MLLQTRRWGAGNAESVVCVHGIAQHGGIFEALGRRLAEEGFEVVSVDLRGHGDSGREPPWSTDAHVDDLLETADSLEIGSATWIGHSFGGRLVAALGARVPERADRLVLLDPGFSVPPGHALKSAEIDRLDWSFASVEGAVNALLSADTVVAAPKETVTAFATDYLERGSDGRLRFRYSPSAAVVAWNEVTLPSPPIAPLPTLLVRPVTSAIHSRAEDRRYRDALGSRLVMTAVPHGHNVLWESPAETAAAIAGFLATPAGSPAGPA
jgi:lipase